MSKYITDKRYTIFLLLIILAVIIIFAGIILWPDISQQFHAETLNNLESSLTIQPTPTQLPTSFPDVIPDYFDNEKGTNGLLAGSVVLVLVILLGVLISIRNNEK